MALKQSTMLVLLVAGASFSAGAASASTVCLNATHGSTNYGPDASCPTSVEQEIFLQDAKDKTAGFGNIGSQTGTPVVEFTSTPTAALDFANGNATIKPEGTFFPTLTISIPGHSFTDLLFDLQLLKTDSSTGENLTVNAWDGTTLERTFTYSTLAHDADIHFTVVDASGLTAVGLSSTSGIKEAKHFDVSGVDPIPEPSTLALMMLGFAGLGYAAIRRAGKSRLSHGVA
jgi:hypothetical protein